jgi:hypothetical protein
MRPSDHVTLNFNDKMSAAAVILDIENAFDTTTLREMQACVPQGTVLSTTLYNLYINGAPQSNGVHLALFADDTCLYATDRKRFLLSENSSAVSTEWRPGVSAGI